MLTRTPNDMAIDAYPDTADAAAVKRECYAAGVAEERARIARILRDMHKGDWLTGRLHDLVSELRNSLA